VRALSQRPRASPPSQHRAPIRWSFVF
jgi:hypothetical protein